jgi:deoxyribonuclease V
VRLIGGAAHDSHGLCAWGSVAAWDAETREVIAWAVARENVSLPYSPGRLAYSVSPAISAALLRLPAHVQPEVLLVHGHGTAHPRRFGLASHLGMIHRIATVGVAEKLLIGEHEPVPALRGEWRPIVVGGEVVGAAVRTRAEAKVMYVSPGWGCGLEAALEVVMAATLRFRWPEPIRLARMRLKAAHPRRLELHRERWQRKMGAA